MEYYKNRCTQLEKLLIDLKMERKHNCANSHYQGSGLNTLTLEPQGNGSQTDWSSLASFAISANSSFDTQRTTEHDVSRLPIPSFVRGGVSSTPASVVCIFRIVWNDIPYMWANYENREALYMMVMGI